MEKLEKSLFLPFLPTIVGGQSLQLHHYRGNIATIATVSFGNPAIAGEYSYIMIGLL